MSECWVCKFDGTLQCQDDPEIPLEVMQAELASLIGESNILEARKHTKPMIRLCGMPTGSMNAYKITELGKWILFHGTMGPSGFSLCMDQSKAELVEEEQPENVEEPNFGQFVEASKITSAIANPVFVRELIGHPLRVYEEGSSITMDFVPSRVNVVTNGTEIADIWFG